jgi:hypothetical protein
LINAAVVVFICVCDALICFVLCFVCEMLLFIRLFLKSLVICLTSLPKYIKVAHFQCGGWGPRVCFDFIVVEVVFRLCLCHTHYFVVCFDGVFFCLF